MELELQESLLKSARVSFACRRVNLQNAKRLIREPYRPVVGDVVLAEIEKLGQHPRIELVNGRRAMLSEGDLVVLSYGNRYAPDQFEGLVPHNLGPCDMVAAGGIAATAMTRHARMKRPTRIRPLGVIADASGRALNLSDYRRPMVSAPSNTELPPVFIVCGTSMNAGKTHVACNLITGFKEMGYRVGAVKLTGTGAGGDLWRMNDSGAETVLDFTDAGLPATYMEDPQTLIRNSEFLLKSLAADNVDVIVAEIADGIGLSDTCALLQSERIKSVTSGVLFAAGDALGASAGYKWLTEQELPVLAISGLLTLSPLAVRELLALTPCPVLTNDELISPAGLRNILPADAFAPREEKEKAPGKLMPHTTVLATVGATPAARCLQNG